MFSLISERKLGDRRRSDTVVVLTINYADWGSDGVIILTRSAPYEKSKSLGSGGSMVARLKLKDIDGRAPPGVNTVTLRLYNSVDPVRRGRRVDSCPGCAPNTVGSPDPSGLHTQCAGNIRARWSPPRGRKIRAW